MSSAGLRLRATKSPPGQKMAAVPPHPINVMLRTGPRRSSLRPPPPDGDAEERPLPGDRDASVVGIDHLTPAVRVIAHRPEGTGSRRQSWTSCGVSRPSMFDRDRPRRGVPAPFRGRRGVGRGHRRADPPRRFLRDGADLLVPWGEDTFAIASQPVVWYPRPRMVSE